MGRKKVKRTRLKSRKRTETLEKRFNCPLCSHENVVHCVIQRQQGKASAMCSICDAMYVCRSTKLTSAIDVYSAWIDELDSQNK